MVVLAQPEYTREALNVKVATRMDHAFGMRPPVPETILVKGQITGTEHGG
jgi:hypothetical protein